MQRGPGRARSVVTIGTALALLGAGAATASAGSGGAGLAAPAPKRAAAPALEPVRGLPQLSASLGLRKVSRRAASAVTLRYASRAGGPLLVRVDVVRLADGLSVFQDQRLAQPGAAQAVRWSGRAGDGVALDGGYELRVSVGDAAASSRTSVSPGGAAPEGAPPPPGSASVGRFTFVGAVFPVRGEHGFGEEAARFGAGRGGRSHEGQDVMAACGTPLVAARGGVVTWRARHARAGNYLVIHDPITGQDHMYAHLRARALVKRGQRVETGQPIGVVGDTGSASACHLHFEVWTAPGWYKGGAPVDPLPALLRWDRVS